MNASNFSPLVTSHQATDVLRNPSYSSYREQLVEYLVIAALLQDGWMRRGQAIDILRADVDGAGYDFVVECQGIARHVQMKSSVVGGRTGSQKVHTALAKQPSGCVVWVVLAPGPESALDLTYLVFGGGPGEPLPNLKNFKTARHTKANAEGVKANRPAIRELPKSAFSDLGGTAALSDWLFGKKAPAEP